MASSLVLGVGCAGDQPPPELIECESGQCDLFDGIKDLRDDVRRIDSGDLFSVAGEIATDAVNDALELGDFSFFKIKDPEIFALAEEASDDHTLNDIDALVSGLARRYGEKHLTAEVNRIRRDHLLHSDDDYFAEAAFTIGPELSSNFNWSVDVAGLDETRTNVGFEFKETVETRVIAAVEKEREGYYEAPLAAFKAARGHVLPVDTDDVLDMKPGELLGLSGVGSIALNFGAGIPIFSADPGAISYK
ncbi:MAG: hypothetical protein KJO07_19410, partial [Deltaproteobacteria bacterium]|nr:hypothetical protein [Deltaproteobacteria bacterium]